MKRLFFDMDNVLVDFASGLERLDEATKKKYEGHLDDVPGIFGLMDPMPGAIDAVHRLAKKYDVYILSTAPWKNPSAWSDKVAWVTKYFDDVFRLMCSTSASSCLITKTSSRETTSLTTGPSTERKHLKENGFSSAASVSRTGQQSWII